MGANYEESQAAYSKKDFNYKIGICLREARETNYWVRIIKEANVFKGKELEYLIQESTELKKIFSAILKKVHYRKTM